MKKVGKAFLLAAMSCAVLMGCQDLTEEQDDLIQDLIESGELVAPDYAEASYISPLPVITVEPEILDDANFDVAIDLLEEKSGHWINHIVSSRLPGEVANAVQNGEAELILGAWENKWVEYGTKNFWRNDWQLVRFDADIHYLTFLNEIQDKYEKIHDFSDCLTAGTYYLKVVYNDVEYKGYFDLKLPTTLQEYVDSITFDGIVMDSTNVNQFAVLLEGSLDKTITTNKVEIGGKLTTDEFKTISAYLRSNDKYISEIDLSMLDLEVFPSSNEGAGSHSIFYQCKNLKKVTLPSNLRILGEGAFTYCTTLEEVILPSTLEEIEWSAFAYCSNLKSIFIPASVKIINQTVFTDCTSLEEVIFEDGSKLERLGQSCFSNCYKLKNIVIPASVIDLTPITSRTTYTASNIFKNCSSLTTVTLYNSVKTMKSTEFNNCPELSTINFYGTEEEWNAIKNKPTKLNSITVNFITE